MATFIHCTHAQTSFLANQIAWLPVNIYSIQTGRINRHIFGPCENVNKTFTGHKCRKTNLTGNFVSSTRMAKCFLTKMTAQTEISVLTGPKRTMKRTKSAAREKGFKILLMVRSKKQNKKNSIQDQVRLEHIFTIIILSKKNWKQKHSSDTCWWTCFFMTVRKQNGGEPSDLSSM